MKTWLTRLALRCVPGSWRASVQQDLEDEAGRAVESSWRIVLHALAVGMRLRTAFMFEELGADARDVFRSLTRSPGFSLAAILTVSIGIAANVVVFSVVDRLLFRPLPYAAPDRLVQIHQMTFRDSSDSSAFLPMAMADELGRRTSSLDGIAWADGYATNTVLAPGESPIAVATVRSNTLRVLGLRPIVGRDFDADDTRVPGQLAVLLTFEAWQARFAHRADVVGLSWGQRPAYRIVGVLPPGFLLPSSRFVEHVDGIAASEPRRIDQPGWMITAPFARLKPGATVAEVQGEVDALLRDTSWAGSHLASDPKLGRPASATVQPLRDGLNMLVRPYLWLISGGVWVLLAAACANLATLLVVRTRAREYDSAIKSAMGASATRLVRHAVLESIVLCAAASAIAVAVCAATHAALVAVVPPTLHAFIVAPLDRRLIAATVLATFAAALLASVPPASRVIRSDVMAVFRRNGSRTATTRRGSGWLLAAQAAFGVVVLAGAVMTVPGFMGLLWRSPGFEPSNLYVVTVNHGASMSSLGARGGGGARVARARTMRDAMRGLPHVRGAAVALQVPFGGLGGSREFWKSRGLVGEQWSVDSGYFQTAGTALLAGRDMRDDEIAAGAPVAVLSETGAHALWPDVPLADVPGRSIQSGTSTVTVVGVSRDIRAVPGQPVLPTIFAPLTATDADDVQSGWPVVVRMDEGVAPDRALLIARLNAAFGTSATVRVQSVEDLMAPFLDRPRFLAVLFGSLAFAALGLTLVGLYAVANLESLQRRFEIGVRVALGASGRDIAARIFRSTVVPVVAGVTGGLIAVWWASASVRATVGELSVTGPRVYGAAAALLIAAAIAASWLPARRAARVDPATVLRES
jgi:predicted permease